MQVNLLEPSHLYTIRCVFDKKKKKVNKKAVKMTIEHSDSSKALCVVMLAQLLSDQMEFY